MEACVPLITGLIFVCFLNNGLADGVNMFEELQLMKGQIDKILKENTNLKQELKVISAENADLKRRTLILERKVNGESWSTFQTGQSIEHSSKTINNMKSKHNTSLINEESAHSDGEYLMNDHISDAEKETEYLDTRRRRLLMPITPPPTGTLIAFSARVKDILTNLGEYQDIPFLNEGIDIGQTFHPSTGVFTCPQNGVYAFFLTIMTFQHIREETEIVKDGIPLAFAYSFSDTNNPFGTGSASVIVRLQKGEKVWVRVFGNNHSGSGNMIYKDFSSFMGLSLLLE